MFWHFFRKGARGLRQGFSPVGEGGMAPDARFFRLFSINPVDSGGGGRYIATSFYVTGLLAGKEMAMKVVASLKTLKNRHPACRVVRRRGRVYVINKKDPRFKARQG